MFIFSKTSTDSSNPIPRMRQNNSYLQPKLSITGQRMCHLQMSSDYLQLCNRLSRSEMKNIVAKSVANGAHVGTDHRLYSTAQKCIHNTHFKVYRNVCTYNNI